MEKISKDKDLFREYRTYLRLERNYSSNTIESYEMDLDKLRSYAQEHSLDIVHTSFEQLQAFLFDTFKTCTSPATQARVLAGIHAWYRFLLYKNYIDQDPSELLEGPRKEYLPNFSVTKALLPAKSLRRQKKRNGIYQKNRTRKTSYQKLNWVITLTRRAQRLCPSAFSRLPRLSSPPTCMRGVMFQKRFSALYRPYLYSEEDSPYSGR